VRIFKNKPVNPWSWVVAVVLGVAFLGIRQYMNETSGTPDSIWRQAEQDLQASRFDQVKKGVERLTRLRTPTDQDWMLRAQLAMAQKRPDDALEDLSRIPDDAPLAGQARLMAGQLELRRGRVAKSEVYFRKALQLDPKLVQAHRELIYIYGMELRRPELSAEFRALSGLTPLTFDNAFHWCLTRTTLWEPSEITEMLRAWAYADPDDRWAKLALADNLRQVGKRDEALSTIEGLPDTDPDAIVVRVRVALDKGDAETAETLLAKGPPDHPELARFRGRIALSKRDGPGALKAYKLAYQADPDHRDSIHGVAQALEMTGDSAAAKPLFELARKHDALNTLVQRISGKEGRADPTIRRALGSACEAIGRIPEAQAWYQLAIEEDPLDTDSQKALFRLKGGP
jgi:tetratricopeptide (TPR) repeat protein